MPMCVPEIHSLLSRTDRNAVYECCTQRVRSPPIVTTHTVSAAFAQILVGELHGRDI
jgi:hypothetical protein